MAVKVIGGIHAWDQNRDSEGELLNNGNVRAVFLGTIPEINEQIQVNVDDVDPGALNAAIVAAVQAAVQATAEAEPYNIEFGLFDTVRVSPTLV